MATIDRKKIIEMYNRYGNQQAVRKVLGYNERTIRKVLHSQGITTWKPQEYGFSKMRKEDPKKLEAISGRAGRIGGVVTHQEMAKNPSQYSYEQRRRVMIRWAKRR